MRSRRPGITMIGSGSQSGMYSPNGTRCHLSYTPPIAPPSITANRLLRGRCRSSKRTLPTSVGAPPVACSIACRAAFVDLQQAGKRRLGPDHHRRTVAGLLPPLFAQREVRFEDPHRQRLVELLALRHVALHQHDAQRRSAAASRSRSRIRPTAIQAASNAAPPTCHRRPSTGTAASSSVARVSPCTPTQAAGWMKTSPIGPGNLPHAAPRVPREAGQHELPRQVGEHPRTAQRQDARPAAPCQARQRRRQRR